MTTITTQPRLNRLGQSIGAANSEKGWRARYDQLQEYGESAALTDHVFTKVALIGTEVSEALEEVRNGRGFTETYYRNDGKPEGLPSELADIIVRALDTADMLGIDIDAALTEKLAYNATREHMHGGKVL